jgi:hypothetical protein
LWRPFWKCRLVEIFRYQESIWDIIIYLHMKFHWNRTMLNLCGIVAAILKMATGRNFYVGNQFGTSLSTHISNFDDIGQCWIFAVLWWPFWKWQPVEIFTSGINSGQHYLPTYQILMISDNVEFLCRVLAAILKMADIFIILTKQNCSPNGDLSLCQILCLYHYPFRSYQH